MTDIFQITEKTGTYNNWIVSWPGRGKIHRSSNFKTLWDIAIKTDSWRLCFNTENHSISVDPTIMPSVVEYVFKDIEKLGGLVSISFEERDQAERFVEEAEKVIMWKLLSREWTA